MIPSSIVSSLIQERKRTGNETKREVTSKWREFQIIGGQLVSVRFYDTMKNDLGENESILRYAHFLLEDFQINGSLKPEKRYRGIYVIALYPSDLEIRGSFSSRDQHSLSISNKDLIWSEVFPSLGDQRRKRNTRTNYKSDRGYKKGDGIGNVNCRCFRFKSQRQIPLGSRVVGKIFSLNLCLTGVRSYIFYLYQGDEGEFELPSKTPSFEGNFFPDFREINDTCF